MLSFKIEFDIIMEKNCNVTVEAAGDKGEKDEEDQQPKKKRRNIVSKAMCGCNCEDGLIQITEASEGAVRCECTLCGEPTKNVDSNPKRRCGVMLLRVGAMISFHMDGRFICFSCRGYD